MKTQGRRLQPQTLSLPFETILGVITVITYTRTALYMLRLFVIALSLPAASALSRSLPPRMMAAGKKSPRDSLIEAFDECGLIASLTAFPFASAALTPFTQIPLSADDRSMEAASRRAVLGSFVGSMTAVVGTRALMLGTESLLQQNPSGPAAAAPARDDASKSTQQGFLSPSKAGILALLGLGLSRFVEMENTGEEVEAAAAVEEVQAADEEEEVEVSIEAMVEAQKLAEQEAAIRRATQRAVGYMVPPASHRQRASLPHERRG